MVNARDELPARRSVEHDAKAKFRTRMERDGPRRPREPIRTARVLNENTEIYDYPSPPPPKVCRYRDNKAYADQLRDHAV
jgi:hypothetical protein